MLKTRLGLLWTKDEAGKLRANVGAFVLDGAYGGWKLARICSDGGGQSDVSSGGFVTKRELYDQLHGMINLLYSEGSK
jgi:hypothetical protein